MKKTLLLLTLAALLLVGCADMSDPSRTLATEATTTAVTTTDPRDVLTNPESLSDIELEIVRAMWKNYQRIASSEYSIDHLAKYVQQAFLTPCGDGYALFMIPFEDPGNMVTEETLGGYEFRYDSTDTLDYYRDGEFCTLAEAYADGKLTDEQICAVWEAYSTKYAYNYGEDWIW